MQKTSQQTTRLCEKCKKPAHQLNLDRLLKMWVCNNCFFKKHD